MKQPGTLLLFLIVAAVAAGGFSYGWRSRAQSAGLREQRDFLEKRVRLLETENVRLAGLVDRLERAGSVDDPEAVIRRDLELVVSEMRGLEWTGRVPYKIVTRDGVSDLAREKLRGQGGRAETERRRMRALSALGLLDLSDEGEAPDWDRLVGRLYNGGASAIYDEARPAMYVARDATLEEAHERVLLVHEMTVALLDQHYDLESFLNPEPDMLWRNSDAALARRAVATGDATLLTLQYNTEYGSGMVLADREMTEFGGLAAMVGLIGSDGKKGKVPESAAFMAIFPHTEGRSFCSAIAGGAGFENFDSIYGRPPSSTAEIMHPESYRGGDFTARRYDWKEEDLGLPEREILWSDVAGELGVLLLLRRSSEVDSARGVAEGWRGDRYVLYGDAGGEAPGDDLLWVTSWKDGSAAAAFRDALGAALQRRYGLKEKVSGSYDGERFLSLEIVKGGKEVVLVDAATAESRTAIRGKYP